MADVIRLCAGNKAGMPTLLDRQPAYVRDENALYIGTPDGNKKVGSDVEARVEALETRADALEARKAAAQSELASDADVAAVVAAFNSLLAAMKDGGIMNT